MNLQNQLLQAIVANDSAKVLDLVARGVKVNGGLHKTYRYSIPRVPLLVAIEKGHTDMVRLILEQGGNPNQHHANNMGRTNYPLEQLLYCTVERWSQEERSQAVVPALPENMVHIYVLLRQHHLNEAVDQTHIQAIYRNAFLKQVYEAFQVQALRHELQPLIEQQPSGPSRKI